MAKIVSLTSADNTPRLFREITAVVVQRCVHTHEPLVIHTMLDHGNLAMPGDRVELINILVPEECFTTP